MTQPSFGVDPTQLAPIAENMDRLGDHLTGVERRLHPYAGGTEAVFGEYGAARAWTDLLKLWTDEVQIASWAAHEWSESLRQVIDDYLSSDGDSARRLGSR